MDQGNRSAVNLQSAHHRNGDAVIATQGNQGSAGFEYLLRRLLGATIMLLVVRHVSRDIAAIHYLYLPVVEQGATEIPVVV